MSPLDIDSVLAVYGTYGPVPMYSQIVLRNAEPIFLSYN